MLGRVESFIYANFETLVPFLTEFFVTACVKFMSV